MLKVDIVRMFMATVSALALSLTLLASSCRGYPSFLERIPNGRRVMHPCIPFLKWYGVGHTNPFGGGPKNKFGNAFAAAGFRWTAALCAADTDGDGKTNGEELGDPSCTWSPGATPSRTTDITHPAYKPFDLAGCFCPFNILCPFPRRVKN